MKPCRGRRAPRATPVLEEQPRDRLLRRGAVSLSDAELLAVLLRPGLPGHRALGTAQDLLADLGGLRGLLCANPRNTRRPGLGQAKTASLLAAIELSRRLARTRIPRYEPMSTPGAVAAYLSVRHTHPDHEIFGALYLDSRHRLLADVELYRGTLSHASVEPRAVLKEGLARSAKAFVLFHNHPAADPSPSREDIEFTQRMAEAGEVVGIRLHDHIIVGQGGQWVALSRLMDW